MTNINQEVLIFESKQPVLEQGLGLTKKINYLIKDESPFVNLYMENKVRYLAKP
jgi:hypothetical protein